MNAAGAARKLVFINRYYRPDQSATSQLLTDLASRCAADGIPVHVICSRQLYDRSSADLAPREVVAGVEVHRIWTTRFGRERLLGRALDYGTFYMSGAVALVRLLSAGDVLVAKTDPPLLSILASVAARCRGARLINWLQDIFPEVASALGANPLPRALDRMLRRWRDASLRFAHVNVVIGERMQVLVRRAGVSEENVRIIENWTDLGPTAPTPVETSRLRQRLGLQGKYVVAYSGNLGRAHDFKTLLEAAVLFGADDEIVFLMIGGGAGMAQLALEVARRGLRNFLYLPPQPRESLADCLAAADVHWLSLRPALEGVVVPSKYYGILAAARPVVFIGDPAGELAQKIRAADCGAVVPPGQFALLADVLSTWRRSPEERARVGGNGRRAYDDHHRPLLSLDRWKVTLDAVLECA